MVEPNQKFSKTPRASVDSSLQTFLGQNCFENYLELSNGVVKKHIVEISNMSLLVRSMKTGLVVKTIDLEISKI